MVGPEQERLHAIVPRRNAVRTLCTASRSVTSQPVSSVSAPRLRRRAAVLRRSIASISSCSPRARSGRCRAWAGRARAKECVGHRVSDQSAMSGDGSGGSARRRRVDLGPAGHHRNEVFGTSSASATCTTRNRRSRPCRGNAPGARPGNCRTATSVRRTAPASRRRDRNHLQDADQDDADIEQRCTAL